MSVLLIFTVANLADAGKWLQEKGLKFLVNFSKEEKQKLKATFIALSETILLTLKNLKEEKFPSFHQEMMVEHVEELKEILEKKARFKTFLIFLEKSIEIENVFNQLTSKNKALNLDRLEKSAAAFKNVAGTEF